MIYAPFTLLLLLLLVALLAVFVVLVEMRVLAYAYRKVGVRPRYAFAVMLLSLLGSHVNIPLYSVPGQRVLRPHEISMFGRTYIVPDAVETGATVVALNVGGALIPILVSIYLVARTRLYGRMAIGVAIVAAVVHSLAQIVPGMGIAVPMFIPPLVAAGVGLLLAFRRAPPVAYVSGSMGTLVGADLLNLDRIAQLGAPIVSIGGAGTFDGVFLTGIIAGLLA
ncbi:MAG: hypothetical protein DME12_04815 [Candidatus Rokuibacteriota bacterium]|nr:MAG: hypothetical protein DME12_04815 [Candidatus Rokubacteria bacterium]PYN65870.1 MAG: hypothetical protein DMD93_19940 [Candidatus Rokubacteria bacterium]